MSHRLLWTPLTPGQLFARLQLPFIAGVLFMSSTASLAVPALRASFPLLIGVVLAVAASAAFLWPRARWLLTAWGVVIPLVDIVALAFVRAALLPYLPAVGMLCLIPFAWIALRFSWPALFVIFGGGVVVAGLPFVLGGEPVTTLLEFLNVITLPLVATGMSVGIHLAAIGFRRGRERVEAATRRLHATLEQSRDDELVLRTVLDTVNGAVAFYDADNRLVFANRAAEKLGDAAGFRFDTPPYAAPRVFRADRETPIPADQQIIPRALRGEVIKSQMQWLGEPGDQVAILASSRRVHRESGELLGTVVAAYDVTDLADAIEVREEFLTTVSHELRTPLTSVVGYTDEVVDILGDEAERLGVDTALGAIARNGEVLLERVSQLLTAGNKKIVLTPAVVDVTALVGETVEAILPFARQAGVAVEMESDDDVAAELDPRRIGQAVENVLTNAVKFTGRGGSVSVRVRRSDDDQVHISIADTGIGMTAEEKRRVFDRFYRSKAVRQNAVQGIGVGLSIVKSIVGAHRGEITVESEPGRGTTIVLCLPLTLEPQQPAEDFVLSA